MKESACITPLIIIPIYELLLSLTMFQSKHESPLILTFIIYLLTLTMLYTCFPLSTIFIRFRLIYLYAISFSMALHPISYKICFILPLKTSSLFFDSIHGAYKYSVTIISYYFNDSRSKKHTITIFFNPRLLNFNMKYI